MKSRCSAFVLRELVVIMAVLGVLALLHRPAQARTQAGSQTFGCMNNLRQLANGWLMYAADKERRLVANGDGASQYSWVTGWLDYSASSANTSTLYLTDPRYALMGPYVSDAAYFRCPEDPSTVRIGGRQQPRVRSYAMNGAVGNAMPPFLGTGYRTYLTQSDLTQPDPSALWVFIDEHPDSINDGYFALAMPSSPASTAWTDFPSAYHNGGAGLAFADGHVQVHRWQDARTRISYTAGGTFPFGAQPNNVDVLWLAARTSARMP